MRGLFKKATETKLRQTICEYENKVSASWQKWVRREPGKPDAIRDDKAFMYMTRTRRSMNNAKNEIIAALRPKKDEAFKKHKKLTAYEVDFTSRITAIATYYDALLLDYVEKRPDIKEWAGKEAELDEGDFESAAQALSSDTPPVRGLYVHEKWVASAPNTHEFAALVAAVASGAVPLVALQPNHEWLDAQAEEKKEMLLIAGIVAQRVPSLRVRAFSKAEREGYELELAVGNQKSSKV